MIERERYTPFGITMDNPASLKDQAGFTDHIKDSATGLNYMQARYYDPIMGQFLSVDPVDFIGGGGNPTYFNRYAYVGNDPINLIDPLGMYATCSDFSDAGNGQSCVEVSGVTGQNFESLDAAAKAAGDALNTLSVKDGNEWGIAFTENEDGTFTPTVAVSGVVGEGRDITGEAGSVSITPLVQGTENVAGSGHNHGSAGAIIDNMLSTSDGKVANRFTQEYGAHESYVFTPSGYPQQTDSVKRTGNFGFRPSSFSNKPTSTYARIKFENYVLGQ